MIMVLGLGIAANFDDCTINRQQRLVPFFSMPKPQKSKWGNDIRNMYRNCMMQLPLLLSHLHLSSSPPSLLFSSISLLRSPLRDAASSPLSSALHCMMQLPLLPHLQLSSPPSNSSAALLLWSQLHDTASSPLKLSSPPQLSTAWCSFLSSAALPHLSSPHLSPPLLSTAWCSFLSSLALHCMMQLPLLPHLQLSSLLHLTPLLLSSDLHCVMQLPLLLSHLQLSSPPSLLLRSPLRDAASCSPPSSAALLHLTPLLRSPLRDAAPSPLQLSSPPSLLRCMMQFPLLSSAALLSPISLLRCSPLRDAASSAALLSSAAWCKIVSSPPFLLSCSPLRDAASSQLYSPLLLHSPFLLPCSSSLFLHHSPLPPLLLFSLPFFSSSRHQDWVIQCQSAIQTL